MWWMTPRLDFSVRGLDMPRRAEMIDFHLDNPGSMSVMATPLSNVQYAPASSPRLQSVVVSVLDFDATVARLKQAITELDLWLIDEVNPQILLERGGYAIQSARQLFFFHPRYLVRLLGADPAALVEIPLKLVVLQMPDGSVTVRHKHVEELLSPYRGVSELAGELAEISSKLVATVCQPGIGIAG
jgi:uncharacterized protein (DUF302 family)